MANIKLTPTEQKQYMTKTYKRAGRPRVEVEDISHLYRKEAEARAVTQAERIIAKFGGKRATFTALKNIGRPYNLSTVYRWTYPRRKSSGIGGIIPPDAMRDIVYAARVHGIVLTAEDMDPRPTYVPPKKRPDGAGRWENGHSLSSRIDQAKARAEAGPTLDEKALAEAIKDLLS